jgi:hypothetical protein
VAATPLRWSASGIALNVRPTVSNAKAPPDTISAKRAIERSCGPRWKSAGAKTSPSRTMTAKPTTPTMP